MPIKFNAKLSVGERNMPGEEVAGGAIQGGATQTTIRPVPDRHRVYFLYSGMAFLMTALVLFLLTGYMVYKLSSEGPLIHVPTMDIEKTPPPTPGVSNARPMPLPGELTQRDIYNFYGGIISFSLAPLVCLVSAIICSIVGTRLLRASGAVTTQVIAPQDYPTLGPAISAGNEKAVTQFIRLSSLTGITGTFTKIGLTGLPLATISLTLLLGLAGLANVQFFDLAKLTLGAFLGSFVQRQAEPPEGAHKT
jgi:hypothetical protein